MKKYTKPMIVFESFTLSTNIAANCEAKADGPTGSFYTCGIWLPYIDFTGSLVDVQAFSGSWSGCDLKLSPDDAANNGYCYDIPTEGTPLFNS